MNEEQMEHIAQAFMGIIENNHEIPQAIMKNGIRKQAQLAQLTNKDIANLVGKEKSTLTIVSQLEFRHFRDYFLYQNYESPIVD